ncbi:MAG: signal peptide peptidase SppA [Thermoanaerobaculia bacterium]
MKKLIIVIVVVLALLAILSIGMVVALLKGPRGTVEAETWIELDLSAAPAEYVPEDPLSALLYHKQPRLLDVVSALDRAATDERVAGLVAWLPGTPMGLATAQELRQAVERFRAGGKQTVAYADTIGEWSAANGSYFVASAFEKIYIQPSGDVGLTGLAYVSPFLRGTLDKLGVIPQMEGRHEYKNAVNTFIETEYTEAHREAMQSVMGSQFDQIVQGIALGRDLQPQRVRGLIDEAPFLGEEAVKAGLVDGLKYRDEVYEEISGGDPEALETRSPQAYLKAAGRPPKDATTVALIYGVGGVVRGESGIDPLSGDVSMGSQTLAQAFRDAVEDDDVRGILFRVNSPGGSYVASDTIYREVARARAEGKPVVVSMGDVAASGGYFVAMDADRIVAQPGTITGSIGVLGGKLVTRDMWAKLGITFDEVHTSDSATIWSSAYEYSDGQWTRIDAALDRIYADFTAKVAAGRDLPLQKVQRVARGRIWSGTDALELGLVDALGGYDEALAELRAQLELEEDAPLKLEPYPHPKTPFEALMARFSGETETGLAVAARRILETARPLIQLARRLGVLESDPQPLRAPL